MQFDSDLITKNYTEALSTHCDAIEAQLQDSGMDVNYSRLLSIQATYNIFKKLVSCINDVETQNKIFQVIEADAKNLVFVKDPTVPYIGNS